LTLQVERSPLPHGPHAAEGRGPLLVVLDGSPAAEQALWQVRPLIERLRLPLVLWRCVPGPDAAASEQLTGLAAALSRQGVDAAARVRTGAPAVELLAELEATRPYLTAIVSDGGPGLVGWRRDEVTRALLRSSPTPLLLCRPLAAPARPFRRLLVPLDDGERSAAILPLVEDLARAHGARVLLLRVSRRRDHLHDPWPIDAEGLAGSLYAARTRLAAAGVEVEALGRFGDPAAEIVSCAEERAVDLIALSGGAPGGLTSWLRAPVLQYVRREFAGAILVHRSG
jgi:nucleotide-binding universal stress UspA family protein